MTEQGNVVGGVVMTKTILTVLGVALLALIDDD